jgi:integrase
MSLLSAWRRNLLLRQQPKGAKSLRRVTLRPVWKPLLEKAELRAIHFHAAARHTIATPALEIGVRPKVVQERLGHSRIDTTLDVSSHVPPSLQREAGEALDGDFFRAS